MSRAGPTAAAIAAGGRGRESSVSDAGFFVACSYPTLGGGQNGVLYVWPVIQPESENYEKLSGNRLLVIIE